MNKTPNILLIVEVENDEPAFFSSLVSNFVVDCNIVSFRTSFCGLRHRIVKRILNRPNKAAQTEECSDNALGYVNKFIFINVLGFELSVRTANRSIWNTLRAGYIKRGTL